MTQFSDEAGDEAQPRGIDVTAIADSLADPERFWQVYELHKASVHRYLLRRAGADVADDLTDETFLAAFDSRERFDLSVPTALRWLYGIAGNLIYRHWRTEVTRYRAMARVAADPTFVDDHADQVIDRLIAAATGRRLTEAVSQLTAKERDVFALFVQDNQSYQDIADHLGIPIGTVRSSLNRARRRLRDILGYAVTSQGAAMNASDKNQALSPRPDQYIFRQVEQVTGTGLHSLLRWWESADGSRPGKHTASGDIFNQTDVIPPYQDGQALTMAPYLRLAQLPTDPDELLQVLQEDHLATSTRGSSKLVPTANRTMSTMDSWNLIRHFVERAPAPQQAALFRAALNLPRRLPAKPTTGRIGDAVGMLDDGLGFVELVFDSNTHRYLGSVISSRDDDQAIGWDRTVQCVAVVDEVDQLPPILQVV